MYELVFVNQVTKARALLFIAEALISALCVIANMLFLRILCSTSTVHRNVKAIFVNFSFSGIFLCLTRLYLIPGLLHGNNDRFPAIEWSTADLAQLLPWFTHDIARFHEDANFWMLVVERSVSTLRSRTYERLRNNAFTALLVIFPWTWSLMEALIIFTESMHRWIFWIINAAVTLVACLVFILLNYANNIKYHKRIGNLSERYQVAENLKTAAAVYRYMQLNLLRHATLFFMQLAHIHLITHSGFSSIVFILLNLYDLAIALYILATPLFIVGAHSTMSARTRQLCSAVLPMRRRCTFEIGVRIESGPSPQNDANKSADNSTLASEIDTVKYFQMLKRLWEHSAPIDGVEKDVDGPGNATMLPRLFERSCPRCN